MASLEKMELLSEEMQHENMANHDYRSMRNHYPKSEINFIMTIYRKHELFLVIQGSFYDLICQYWLLSEQMSRQTDSLSLRNRKPPRFYWIPSN